MAVQGAGYKSDFSEMCRGQVSNDELQQLFGEVLELVDTVSACLGKSQDGCNCAARDTNRAACSTRRTCAAPNECVHDVTHVSECIEVQKGGARVWVLGRNRNLVLIYRADVSGADPRAPSHARPPAPVDLDISSAQCLAFTSPRQCCGYPYEQHPCTQTETPHAL